MHMPSEQLQLTRIKTVITKLSYHGLYFDYYVYSVTLCYKLLFGCSSWLYSGVGMHTHNKQRQVL